MMGSLLLPAQLNDLVRVLVERHEIPASSATHPKGVIVSGDMHMTECLKDPGYAPYCLKHDSCGRVRRTGFGFQCGRCGNKMNFDMTAFNGNVDVQYDTVSEGL